MSATRKYWIGSSEVTDLKPTDFETVLLYEDLQDVVDQIIDWIKSDFENMEDGENDIPDEHD